MEERLENLFASIKKADAREEVCIIARAIAHPSHQESPLRMDRSRPIARTIHVESIGDWIELARTWSAHSGISGSRTLLSVLLDSRTRVHAAPETHLAKVGALSLSRPSSSRAGRSGDSADSALLAGQRNCRSNTTRRARSPCTHNRQISGGRL